ncbi:ArgS-related anticodon-binding protein NrtL [Streptomyces purpureus]|uniref:ArgS-related anticodon-binding protein NrtL n=1 Tax=Streptomyces purpureus TaxID=1951 RepID=UPI00037D10F6|nr:DALR anticodon-binding domain-containing protein [Streptomyces purpureus]
MTPADLSLTVLRAVRRAVDEGALRVALPERVVVERPRPGGRGDYATNAALRLARDAQLPPLEVAQILMDRLRDTPGIRTVEITGPGFLNLTLDAAGDAGLVRRVLTAGTAYGHGGSMAGQVFQYHHRPEVRAAVVADTVRRLQVAQGASVRTSCDHVDPDWARLGVTVGAEGRPPVELAELRARPAGHTADVLLRRFGADATRWALLRAAAQDRPQLDDTLLLQTEANPLFRVRYAYARSRALLRGAAQLGFGSDPAPTAAPAHTAALGTHPADVPARPAALGTHPVDAPAHTDGLGTQPADAPALTAALGTHPADAPALTAALGDHPVVLESAARLRAPDRVARHLEVIADALLAFQHTVLPLGDEKPSAAHRARLALAEAAGTVLAGGLTLLGISAPEQI